MRFPQSVVTLNFCEGNLTNFSAMIEHGFADRADFFDDSLIFKTATEE